MNTTYIVFDIGALKDGQQYRSFDTALPDFFERIQDGDKVKMLAYHGKGDVTDETDNATEQSAGLYLRDCNIYDTANLPQWVIETDEHDAWLDRIADAKREREQGVA